MSLWCFPSSFNSDLRFGRRCHLKNFKMAALEQNNFHNSESLCHSDLPSSFGSIQRFRRRCYLKNFKMTTMERNNFCNSESRCGSDASHQVLAQSDWCSLKNLKTAAMAAGILERKHFSNSESLCHWDASHQSDTVWEEMSFEEFYHRGSNLGYRNGTILAILNLIVATMPPTKFQLNATYDSGRDDENVKS